MGTAGVRSPVILSGSGGRANFLAHGSSVGEAPVLRVVERETGKNALIFLFFADHQIKIGAGTPFLSQSIGR